jgi:SAM-dependent methyltransferase
MNTGLSGSRQPETRGEELSGPTMTNIAYSTDAISAYFSANRRRWDQFYPSERQIIEQVAVARGGSLGAVLDVGCACGGLGAALSGRYRLSRYVGIDINAQAIGLAQKADDIAMPHVFLEGDIMRDATLGSALFDIVFNLSCADWNVDFSGILAASWARLAPGGTMIISLRLTEGQGARGMDRSYQFIHYGDPATMPADAERAAYVVLNASEALAELCRLGPDQVTGFGYWGPPSATARTPFKRLVFSVFAVCKPQADQAPAATDFTLRLPPDIWRTAAP